MTALTKEQNRQLAGRMRGGYAPGHLREAFERWLDSDCPDTITVGWDEIEVPIEWLLGHLCGCSDILPSIMVAQVLDLGVEFKNQRYGAAAQALLRQCQL